MADDTAKKIADIEAKRAERKAGTEAAHNAQYLIDLVQVDALEVEHGDDRIAVLKMPSFSPGLPTLIVVSTPSPGVFSRFRQMVRKAGQNTEAIGAAKDLLAASCILYPDADTYARMKEAWPSIHDNAGVSAIGLGESEGKG